MYTYSSDHHSQSPLGIAEYRLLVEQAPIMFWRSDHNKKCDYFNLVWLEFRGRTLAQEAGEGWAEGLHPDDRDRCLETWFASFELRRPFEMEYRLLRHDGIYRWIFDRGVPFTRENGVFAGYIGSCIDVTDRVEAQKALYEATQKELSTLRGLLSICSDLATRRPGQPVGLPLE
jgi:PAS domain S-box-containing protein